MNILCYSSSQAKQISGDGTKESRSEREYHVIPDSGMRCIILDITLWLSLITASWELVNRTKKTSREISYTSERVLHDTECSISSD
jgi:hypothetical protein